MTKAAFVWRAASAFITTQVFFQNLPFLHRDRVVFQTAAYKLDGHETPLEQFTLLLRQDGIAEEDLADGKQLSIDDDSDFIDERAETAVSVTEACFRKIDLSDTGGIDRAHFFLVALDHKRIHRGFDVLLDVCETPR